MHQPIDQRRHKAIVAKYCIPSGNFQIGSYDEALSLVAFEDHPKHKLIFRNDDLLNLVPYHARQIASSGAVKAALDLYTGEVIVLRIGDKLGEALKIPPQYSTGSGLQMSGNTARNQSLRCF